MRIRTLFVAMFLTSAAHLTGIETRSVHAAPAKKQVSQDFWVLTKKAANVIINAAQKQKEAATARQFTLLGVYARTEDDIKKQDPNELADNILFKILFRNVESQWKTNKNKPVLEEIATHQADQMMPRLASELSTFSLSKCEKLAIRVAVIETLSSQPTERQGYQIGQLVTHDAKGKLKSLGSGVGVRDVEIPFINLFYKHFVDQILKASRSFEVDVPIASTSVEPATGIKNRIVALIRKLRKPTLRIEVRDLVFTNANGAKTNQGVSRLVELNLMFHGVLVPAGQASNRSYQLSGTSQDWEQKVPYGFIRSYQEGGDGTIQNPLVVYAVLFHKNDATLNSLSDFFKPSY